MIHGRAQSRFTYDEQEHHFWNVPSALQRLLGLSSDSFREEHAPQAFYFFASWRIRQFGKTRIIS